MAHVSSPTHAFEGTRDDSGVLHLELADGAVLPDRDIVVDFTVPQDAEPRTALFLSPDDNDEAHFMMVAYPPREGAADRRPPIEWLFLSDVSGSMTGPSMDQAREALGQAFSRMRAGDRFNIVPYNHTYWSFSAESVPVTPANVEKGRAFVKGLEASGGTMMLPGLAHLMGLPRHDGVVRYIIVMTDGELGNEDEVLRSLHASLGDARLFVVTVGSAPNHFLAQKMADYGRGSFVGIANGTEIERQMNTLLNRIQSPVLSGIAVDFNGMSADSMYPSRAPDLFVGQPLVMFGRLKGTQGSVAMRGTRDGTAWIREAKLDVKEAQFHAGIRTLWARELVDEQMDTWRQSGSEDERDRLRERITADAIRYRLVTQFTSLVAVEERVVNEGGEQKRVRVPAELPFGMDRAATLGENPRGGTMDDFLDAMSVACALAGLLMLVAARRGRVNAEA